MKRRRYDLPLEPLALLAELSVRTRGCRRAAVARPGDHLIGPPSLPWVVGFVPTVFVEPWSLWHALHRRKHGFSAVVGRMNNLVKHEGGDDVRPSIEVWEDDGELDLSLIEKWSSQLELTVKPVTRAEIASRLVEVEARILAEQAEGAGGVPDDARSIFGRHDSEQNPMLTILAFRAATLSGRPPL